MLFLLVLSMAGSMLLAGISYLFRSWERVIALVAAAYCGLWALLLWFADLSMPVWTPPLIGLSIDLTAPVFGPGGRHRGSRQAHCR